jgi:hypothetical protein
MVNTSTIYATLGMKLKQSIVMSEKQGIQGGENKADGRNSNQGHKDFRKNEDTIKLIQNDVHSNNGEKFNQDKDQTVSDE